MRGPLRGLAMSHVKGIHAPMCSRGGKVVSRRIDRTYVPLRWVRAMAQVQVVQLVVSDHQAVMAVFTPE